MDNYIKAIKALRKKHNGYTAALTTLELKAVENEFEAQIINEDYNNLLNNLNAEKTKQARLEHLVEDKKELIKDIFQHFLASVLIAIELGFAVYFVANAWGASIPAITTCSIALSAGTLIVINVLSQIAPLKKLQELKLFSQKYDLAEVKETVESLKVDLAEILKNKNKIEKVIKCEREEIKNIKKKITEIETYIREIVEARCSAMNSLGANISENRINHIYHSDRKTKNIVKLERKKRNDN